ncbi:hypothetical protein F5148DRAFT_1147904 [Russula earlei]|uniref:Uncharacterized protein n=1 Tax=Russula earlei TaxID=71964 RepID=A0ACC0UDX1_9AGAM|nr:hypothetical protein F5148DRAFT_1147904 [Russula earlei]
MHMECHCCSGGHDCCVVIGSGDLCQLMRHINTQPPSPASSLLAAMQNENGSLGDGDATGVQDSWSDGILDIVAVLGEGASGMVEVVQDKQTGHWFVCKTIIMHKDLLKQLVCELAFLSGLRHTNMVHFYSMYMSPLNSEVKLMMELCKGKSLATVREQI